MPQDFAIAEGVPSLPKKVAKRITVEPPVFFFGLAFGMILFANTQLSTQRICLEGSRIFGDGTVFNQTVCDNIESIEYEFAEQTVFDQSRKLNYISAALQATPAIFFALFAGAWSDMYGRRGIVLLPLLGLVILDIVFVVLAYVEVPADWLLLEALQDITGGMPVMLMGAFAHLCDVSTPKTRTMRFGFLETCYLLGTSAGTAISGPLFRISGYTPLYLLSIFTVFLGVMSIPLFVKKPKISERLEGKLVDLTHLRKEELEQEDLVKDYEKVKEFFRFSNVKDTFRTAFRKRENGNRHVMWLLIFIWACETFVRQGETLIDIFYVRERFGFEDTEEVQEWWRIFFFIHNIWGMLVLAVFIPILKRLYHVTDTCIVVWSAFGSFFRSLTFVAAQTKQNLYIGSIVDMLNLAGSIAARSGIIALMDDPTEIGKAFAVIAVIHELVRVVSPYNWEIAIASRDWYIGLVYCIYSTVFVVVMLVGGYCWWYFRKNKIHEAEETRYGERSAERELAKKRKPKKVATNVTMNMVL